MQVLVQIMTPISSALGSYDWKTIRILDAKTLDINYLKSEARKRINSKITPEIDVLRLVVMRDGIAQMKIFVDRFFTK